ncbi:MAG TPA: GNAT family N-acetyltransferase [Ktedonobacteraceae bacterium]|jgi:GNAT superfamily N-acetyltransferase|nr:GNAT family N-acetyltransferase [Ktedonobacteraceae bacterium]
MKIEVRPARPEDRETVLAFCQQTWDWGDYIEYVWDEWLNDPNGKLFVATADGKPVGLAHIEMVSSSEAWLEGMRVDPAYRNHGIAKALFDAQIEEALRRGATVVRLLTASTNEASIRLAQRAGMQQVGGFAPYHAAPLTDRPRSNTGIDTPTLATIDDLDEIIHYLNVSNIFPVTGGLYYRGFTAYAITREMLARKIEAQQIYLLKRWDRLDGLAMVEVRDSRRGKHLNIGYIDGTTSDSIGLIAYAMRRVIAEMNLEQVSANVPDQMMIQDAFLGAEYETDGEVFYTFERALP